MRRLEGVPDLFGECLTAVVLGKLSEPAILLSRPAGASERLTAVALGKLSEPAILLPRCGTHPCDCVARGSDSPRTVSAGRVNRKTWPDWFTVLSPTPRPGL